jgi:hypothetical protein
MTDDARTLNRFAVEPAGDGFLLTLEDAAGAVVRFFSSEAQLDVLADLSRSPPA